MEFVPSLSRVSPTQDDSMQSVFVFDPDRQYDLICIRVLRLLVF